MQIHHHVRYRCDAASTWVRGCGHRYAADGLDVLVATQLKPGTRFTTSNIGSLRIF
jgi:hypothetical protein